MGERMGVLGDPCQAGEWLEAAGAEATQPPTPQFLLDLAHSVLSLSLSLHSLLLLLPAREPQAPAVLHRVLQRDLQVCAGSILGAGRGAWPSACPDLKVKRQEQAGFLC